MPKHDEEGKIHWNKTCQVMPVVHKLLCSHFTAYSDEILFEKDVTKVFGA